MEEKMEEKMGYDIVVLEDTKHGYLKVKTAPGVKLSLQSLYAKIASRGDRNRWVYHNSGHMLFSGSDKGQLKERTQLKLNDLLEIIREVSR
jgi:hypothetical protein